MAIRQDRVELKGSARPQMPFAQDVGPADPNQQIEVTVLLRRGSRPEDFPSLATLGATPPRQRKYLTREEFARTHGASPADIAKIRTFAADYGFHVVSEHRASRTIELRGTIAAFND